MTKIHPYSRLSFNIAKEIYMQNKWDIFLTHSDIKYFKAALSSIISWQKFINPAEIAEDEERIPESLTAAFHVRTMLAEQFIPYFFHTNKPCCQYNKLNINSAFEAVTDIQHMNSDFHHLDTSEIQHINSNIHHLNTSDIQHMNMSDIQNIDINDMNDSNTLINTPNSSSMDDVIRVIEGLKVENNHDNLSNDKDQPDQRTYPTHIPLLDVYHSLEYDLPAMMDHQKLQDDQPLENTHDEIEELQFNIIDDADHYDFKHLLKGIAENRDKTYLSDRELRRLLLEVRPLKSKWPHESRIGQEELYDTLERILIELKNYTEHSTPFLTRVSRREAPDYYEVIKHPMDLGTVQKKLKQFQYKSRRDFARDLYLIYDNCLAYNSDISSEYRKHAHEMRKKTEKLLSKIPDNSTKDRLSHITDDVEDVSEDDAFNISTLQSEYTAKPRERDVSEGFNHFIHSNKQKHGGKHPQTGKHPIHSIKEPIAYEEDSSQLDLQSKTWSNITKKTRAVLTDNLHKQYQYDFGNRPVLCRSPYDMERFATMEHLHNRPESIKQLMKCSKNAFVRWLERSDRFTVYDSPDISSDDDEHDGRFFFAKSNDKMKQSGDDDALKSDLFLPEYQITAGLPEINGIPEDLLLDKDVYNCGDSFRDSFIYQQNADESHNKVNQTFKWALSTSNIRLRDNRQDDTMLQSPSQFADIGTSQQILQQTLVEILSQEGFESIQSTALNVLTDVVSDYFNTIGTTIRYYWDEYSHSMSGEEILLHTLYDNGIAGLSELQSYIDYDSNNYGLLDELKLEVDPSNNAAKLKEETLDMLFEDPDLYNSGLLGELLEEDYLGIDNLNFSVNTRLRYVQALSDAYMGSEKAHSIRMSLGLSLDMKYKPPPLFTPELSSQNFIRLLQPWYKKRLEGKDGSMEDEYLDKQCHRCSSPPVQERSSYNTVVIVRSKSIEASTVKDESSVIQSNVPDDGKKKRKKEFEEEKAKRKRQRLELRAQKTAEKELKKRQKEELKGKNKTTKSTKAQKATPSQTT
ncbi:hypothetical protein BDB01DRAFT_846642 [Pilobolus umbonatus]|nr:hypothetical protein BDB01DRAFT_846642 [Pilobolus umbonatus]